MKRSKKSPVRNLPPALARVEGDVEGVGEEDVVVDVVAEALELGTAKERVAGEAEPAGEEKREGRGAGNLK